MRTAFRWKQMNDKELARFKKMVASGYQWKVIGKVYGISAKTAADWAKKFGVYKPK